MADGRLPVIAGTGSNSTQQTIDLSLEIGDSGIDAYLVVVPYYNKPMQEGMVGHFTAIADAVHKPVMMYNVPGRTVADMQAETVARLATHDNIFGIKEATGDIDRLRQIQVLVDDNFMLYSGDDFTALEFLENGRPRYRYGQRQRRSGRDCRALPAGGSRKARRGQGTG